MNGSILALNAGSSSLKFRLYEVHGEQFSLILRGQFDGLNATPHLTVKEASGKEIADLDLVLEENMREDSGGEQVLHPLVATFFVYFSGGRYTPRKDVSFPRLAP